MENNGVNIYEKQTVTNTFSFSYTITTNDKTSREVRKYRYVQDDLGSFMISRDESEGEYKSSKTVYDVLTSRSSKVLYIKTYDGAKDKTTIQAYVWTLKGTGDYDNALNKQEAFIKEMTDYYESVVYAISQSPNVGDSYNESFKYYSTGEGNLTAKLAFTYNGQENESAIKKIDRTYEYNNNLLNSYNGTYVTYNGKKRTEVAKASYSNITVELPSDWEEHVMTSVSM